MNFIKTLVSLALIGGTGVIVYSSTGIMTDRPSAVIKISSKRYAIPANSHRSIYKSEAECKNAVSQDLWKECEPARNYYGDNFDVVDAWLGPIYVGDVDPNLSHTAQNLPVSTITADSRNVGQASLSKLVYELKSDKNTVKQLQQTSTTRFVRVQPVERKTKIQPVRAAF